MLPPIKNNGVKSKGNKKESWFEKNCMCLELRQLALVLSIICFIISAVFNTCAVLSNSHTEEILQLLKNDIKEEKERTEEYYGHDHIMSANEYKLHISKDFVLMMKGIFFIWSLVAWINTAVSALLIYGIASKTAIYMIPWILISLFTHFMAVMTETAIYLDFIPGITINNKVLIASVVATYIFMQMWYIITRYYSVLRDTCSSRYATSTPITVNAYGGYKHTIQPFESTKKPMI